MQYGALLGTEDQYGQNQVEDKAHRAAFCQNLIHAAKSFINRLRMQPIAAIRTWPLNTLIV